MHCGSTTMVIAITGKTSIGVLYCALINKFCSHHVSTAIDDRPLASVLDVANKAHHSVHIDGPQCHRLCGFGVVRNVQGRLVCCFSRIDDGDDNLLALGDQWDDAGWQLSDQYCFQLFKVLGAFELQLPAWDMFIYVPE